MHSWQWIALSHKQESEWGCSVRLTGCLSGLALFRNVGRHDGPCEGTFVGQLIVLVRFCRRELARLWLVL